MSQALKEIEAEKREWQHGPQHGPIHQGLRVYLLWLTVVLTTSNPAPATG